MRDEPERARLYEYCSEEGLYSFFFFSSVAFSMPLSLSFAFPLPLHPCACGTLQCLTNNCCVWASTSSQLSQTIRRLYPIQWQGLNSTFSLLSNPPPHRFFYPNKSATCLQEKRNCGYHSHVQEQSFNCLQRKFYWDAKVKLKLVFRVKINK